MSCPKWSCFWQRQHLHGSVALALAVCAVASCGSSPPEFSAGSSYAEGLDVQVVDEILANPAAVELASYPEEGESRIVQYQGMAMYHVLCREALSSYDAWAETGEPTRLQMPGKPELLSNSAAVRNVEADFEHATESIASGDVEGLKSLLADPATCGWIPAKPGDFKGSTIGDVLGGAP